MTDDILDGIFCQQCGEFIGEPVGYPRSCSGCMGDAFSELEDDNLF